jgi:hypothetical protein
MFILFQIIAVMVMGVLLGNTILFSQVNSVSASLVFIVLFHRGLVKVQSLSMWYVQRLGRRDALVATLQDVVNLRPSVISGKKLFTSLKK